MNTKIIYKHALAYSKVTEVVLPVGASIVHVGIDGDARPCIWSMQVITDRDLDFVIRKFEIVTTGEEFPAYLEHHGTIIDHGLVWHVMEHNESGRSLFSRELV